MVDVVKWLKFFNVSSKVLVQERWSKVWTTTSRSLSAMSEPANNAMFHLGCLIAVSSLKSLGRWLVCMYTWSLQNTNVLHTTRFVFLLWHETKQLWGNNQALRVPRSESRASSTRPRCGSCDANYVCLVYKCCLEQILLLFGGIFALPQIYINILSFWHRLQTKEDFGSRY